MLCFCILCLVYCLVYLTCLGYMEFLAGRIYAQSIQSAQIEFSALNACNAISALHEIPCNLIS